MPRNTNNTHITAQPPANTQHTKLPRHQHWDSTSDNALPGLHQPVFYCRTDFEPNFETMSPHMPTLDESLSHFSQYHPNGSTAEDADAEDESEPVNTDEDTERFCAYRNQRYGQSRARGRDLLLRVSQAQDEDSPGPWHFDFEPLGITRPGAVNPNRNNSSNGVTTNGEPEGPSRAGRGRLLMLRNPSSGPERQWSPPAISPRSRDTNAQRTAGVQQRSVQGGNAHNLDDSAISAVESSLEGNYESSIRGPGSPAPGDKQPGTGT